MSDESYAGVNLGEASEAIKGLGSMEATRKLMDDFNVSALNASKIKEKMRRSEIPTKADDKTVRTDPRPIGGGDWAYQQRARGFKRGNKT